MTERKNVHVESPEYLALKTARQLTNTGLGWSGVATALQKNNFDPASKNGESKIPSDATTNTEGTPKRPKP